MLFARAIDLCRSTPGFEAVADVIEGLIERVNKTELARTLLADDNRRLRAACEAVHARLETMDHDIADMTWCYMTLGSALAPGAASGEGGEHGS